MPEQIPPKTPKSKKNFWEDWAELEIQGRGFHRYNCRFVFFFKVLEV